MSTVYSLNDSCVGTIQSDVNCRSEWVFTNNFRADVDVTHHPAASTLVQCQKACEFDPRCVAVDWNLGGNPKCVLSTNKSRRTNSERDHYELVSRCSITPGQCFE